MIRYTLKCPDGHAFESWFKSGSAYDALRASGHVTCPDCGSGDVEKALMAPPVQATRSKASSNDPSPVKGPLSQPADDRARALAALRKDVEDNSDYVGMNFVAEARSMHDGDTPKRSIHGEARIDDAKKLLEDGIPVSPLPFTPKSKTH